MRQTVVHDGVQEKLGAILGNDSYKYSIQESMMDNNKRIHMALLGTSVNGKVMAGLELSASGDEITVEEGYGITKDGKIIEFGKKYSATDSQIETIGTYRVYIKYMEAEIASDVPTTIGNKNIIVDQVGANGESKQADGITDIPTLVFVRPGNPVAGENELFVGTIEVNGAEPEDINIYQTLEDDSVDYGYVESVAGNLGSTNTNLTNFFTSSFIPLPPGKFKIKKMNFLRRKRSTSTIDVTRLDDADNYNFEINVNVVPQSGSAVDIANGAILGDTVIDNDVYSIEFSAESSIIEDAIGIEVRMNNTYTTATIGDYDTAFTGSDVYLTYEIDKFL